MVEVVDSGQSSSDVHRAISNTKFPGESNCKMLRLVVSALFLIVSTSVVLYGIVNGDGSLFMKYEHLALRERAFNALVFIVAFFTLFLNEGFQVAAMRVKDLKATDLDAYPRAKKCHSLLFPIVEGHQQSNMPRLFIGQSFLVVLCTFLLAKLTRYEDKIYILSNSELAARVLSTPLMGIVFTVSLAQLLPSLLAKNYPVQFLQLPFVYLLIKIALLIEMSGIVNCTYVMVDAINQFVCLHNSDENVGKNSNVQAGVDAISRCKFVFSTIFTLSCVGFVFFSIGNGYSTFRIKIVSIQLGLLLFGMITVFYCEGLKIAIVCKYEEIATCATVVSLKDNSIIRTLSSTNDSVERYLLGRQQVVVPIGFLIAQINHFSNPSLATNVPRLIYYLLTGFGFPAVVVMLVFSQLTPQLLAASHVEKFLELPGSLFMVKVALTIEKLGITTVISEFIEFLKMQYPPKDVRFDQIQNPLNQRHDLIDDA